MSGLHLQRGVNDWTRTLTRYPRGIWIKTVDQVQMQDEAWRINNGLFTVLRHWYDPGQIFDTTNQGILRDRMQRFFASFVDGTFNQIVKSAQPGQNVHAIEFWNEFYDPSNNQGTGAQFEYRVASEAAAAEVWANEYRDKPEYRHIRLVHANSAIGNNIPREVAQTCQTYDNLMGYHPYVPVNRNIGKATIPDSEVPFNIGTTSWNGSSNRPKYIPLSQSGYDHRVASFAPESNPNILPGEWPYLSGRWTVMDADWVRHGIRVKWLFTEFGPVGYGIDNGGNAWLKALDGWRHRDVCAGNVDEYLAVIDYWLQRTAAWNKTNGNRALGAVLFTTGGVAPWHDFETKQPEIDAITAFMEAWGPVSPPEPPQPTIRKYQRTAHLLPQNATREQVQRVMDEAHSKRQSVTWSADDSVINPDETQAILTARNVIVWGTPPGGSKAAFETWVTRHYPPLPSITYRDL